MATLTPGQQGTTYRSALGMIAREPEWSHVQLAQWLRDSYENDPSYVGISYSSYAAIARRAQAAHYAGEAMEENPDERINAGQLEQIPGSQYRTDRYQYRVVVTYTDAEGETISTVVEYESNRTVSRNEILADLSSRTYQTSGQGTVDFAGMQLPGGAAGFDIRVIAAGRRAT